MPHSQEMEDPEEAEAWAAMRAAFAEDDAASGFQLKEFTGGLESTSAVDEPDEPEEPEVEEPSPPKTGSIKAGIDATAATKVAGQKQPKKAPAPKWRAKTSAAPAASGKADEAGALYKPRMRPTGEVEGGAGEAWVQSQVDRLIGEVQRTAGAPFAARLLNELWSLPIEDQHDVLLGAIGTVGEALDTKAQKSKRLWTLIQDEVRARGGWHSTVPKGGPRPPTSTAAAPAGRDRSRSRSPSI